MHWTGKSNKIAAVVRQSKDDRHQGFVREKHANAGHQGTPW